MNWMNTWERQRGEAEDRLAGRNLEGDTSQVRAENAAISAAQRELETELARKTEIHEQIENAERYIDTGLWKPGLEMLRDILELSDLSSEDRVRVEELYRQGVQYMEAEQVRHPDEVEEFGHAVLTNHNTHNI
jgi:hypothetical protein